MTKVKRGQVWSLLRSSGGRMDVRVLSVKGPRVAAVVLRTGVKVSLSKSTMERGLRGARLLSKRVLPKKKEKAPRTLPPIAAEATPPKHIRAPNPADERVLALYEEKMTLTEIGRRLGVSKSTVQTRLNRARWAREDAAFMASMGAS